MPYIKSADQLYWRRIKRDCKDPVEKLKVNYLKFGLKNGKETASEG